MQMMYALYPIDTNICKGNWMIYGRNLRKQALILTPAGIRTDRDK
jgi:hypothetical protein